VESLESEIESRKPTVVEQPSDGLENEPNHPGLDASEELEETEVERNPLRENTQRRESGSKQFLASGSKDHRDCSGLRWIASALRSLRRPCLHHHRNGSSRKGGSNGRNPIADYYAL